MLGKIKKLNITKAETIFSVFALIDIFLIPYIRPLHCLTSMLLLLIWYAVKIRKIRPDKEMWAFMLSCVFVGIGIILSGTVMPDTIYLNGTDATNPLKYTITYSAIFVFVYLYYFFFRETIKNNKEILYNTFKALYISVFIFAVIYFISVSAFFDIRSIWSLQGIKHEADIESASYFRYTFSFSDPNNIAALTLALCIIFLENKKEKPLFKAAAFIMCLAVLVASMSTQTFISLGIYIMIKAVCFIVSFFRNKKKITKKTAVVIGVIAVCVVAAGLAAAQLPIISTALDRILNNSNSLQIRLSIWERLLRGKNIFMYLLGGTGCAISIGETMVQPHNGHLYLIYSYGFTAYAAFMYVFFRKRKQPWKNLLFLIPLFICFSINVGLIDTRYAFAMAAVTVLGFSFYDFPREYEFFNPIEKIKALRSSKK